MPPDTSDTNDAGFGPQYGFIPPAANIDSLPHTKTGVVDLDPRWINVDAQSFQFKSGGDKYGVTDRLKDVAKFDPELSGIALVWQDKSGKLFIADGHQRLALAKRAIANGQANDPDVLLPARVYKESEGISKEDIKVIAAYKNIAEGTGTPIDGARLIRLHGELPSTIPPRSLLVRQAKALATLSEDTFNAVYNDRISAEQGAAMAEVLTQSNLAPDARKKMEAEILHVFIEDKPVNAGDATLLARELIRNGLIEEQRKAQTTLFDMDSVGNNILKERVEILGASLRMLKDRIKTPGTVLERGSEMKKYIRGGSGEFDKAAATDDKNDLQIIKFFLEKGWQYTEVGSSVQDSAQRFADLKKKSAEHSPEVQTFLTLIDDSLSQNARELKKAKMKGDTDGEIIRLRAACAREFLGKLEEHVGASEVARALRRSLGHQNKAGEERTARIF